MRCRTVLRGPVGFTAVGRHSGTNQSRGRAGERHAGVGLGSPGVPRNPVCRASGEEPALASATTGYPLAGRARGQGVLSRMYAVGRHLGRTNNSPTLASGTGLRTASI